MSAALSPAVVPFEGPAALKPWNVRSLNPFTEMYRALQDTTPWPMGELQRRGRDVVLGGAAEAGCARPQREEPSPRITASLRKPLRAGWSSDSPWDLGAARLYACGTPRGNHPGSTPLASAPPYRSRRVSASGTVRASGHRRQLGRPLPSAHRRRSVARPDDRGVATRF